MYISDVKVIPASTLAYLQSIQQIKILILDALDRDGIFSHLGLEEALAIVQLLCPTTTYLTGMSCGMGMHDETEAMLQARGLHNVFLAYDGMVLDDLAG